VKRKGEPPPEMQQILSTEDLSEEESKILFDSYAPEETEIPMQATENLHGLRRLVPDCAVEILIGLIWLSWRIDRFQLFGYSVLVCGFAAAVIVCVGFSVSKKHSPQLPSVSYCVLAARLLVGAPFLIQLIWVICRF